MIFDNWPAILTDQKVSEFIDSENRVWDEVKLQNASFPGDVESIRQIHLSKESMEDKMVWRVATDGNLTVKDAYKLEMTLQHNFGPVEDAGWSILWASSVAPKVKLFWWRVLHDILHVGVKLKESMLPVSGCCQVCSHDDETLIHVLFSCPFSKIGWSLLGPCTAGSIYANGGWWKTSLGGFFKWWDGKQLLELCLVGGWYICYNRNQCLHNCKCLAHTACFRFHE